MVNGDIVIRNDGPIEELKFKLEGRGGVKVLRGRNGSGKSKAIRAVQALADRSIARELVVRDGSNRGEVVGLGVELTISRRNTARGELEVSSIVGDDPSTIVDPGYESDDVADEHRLRALCRLGKVETDEAPFAALVGGDEQFVAIASPATIATKSDLPRFAEAFRRDVHKAAKAEESLADNQGSLAAGILDNIKDLDLAVECDPFKLGNAADAATRALVAAEGRQREQRANDARVAEASAKLAAMPTVDAEALEGEVGAAEDDVDDAGAEIAKLEVALAEARAKKALAGQRLQASRDALFAGRKSNADRAAIAEIVARGATPDAERVRDEDLAGLRASLEGAQARVAQGGIVQRALEQKAKAERHADASRDARKRADNLRAAANGIDGVLADAIRKVLPDGLSVSGGRLYVATDRGRELFTELSAGERWRVALDVVINAVGDRGVVAVEQEAWEGLDPANRDAIARHAEARGVWILTAECDAGALRAEDYVPQEGGAS